MLKCQEEITDMLVFGRNYCCSRRVFNTAKLILLWLHIWQSLLVMQNGEQKRCWELFVECVT